MLILTVFSCQNAEQKSIQFIEKEYGIFENENNSIGVELKLNEFDNWKDLLERTERIACSDSLPKLILKSATNIKTVYFRNPCWENYGCILIKHKNTIQIHNDTISKSDRFHYPLDSLATVLKKDFENNGKIPSWSASPEKLMIFISYDNGQMENFPKTLRSVVHEYEKLTDNVVLKIWLNEKLNIPPPPPPPPANWKEETE